MASVKQRIEAFINSWFDKRLKAETTVVFNRNRIYIVPNMLGLSILLMCFVLFLFGTNYQNNLILLLSFFLFSLFFVVLIASYRNLSGLRVTVDMGELVAVGEVLMLQAHWENTRVASKEGLCAHWKQLDKKAYIADLKDDASSSIHCVVEGRGCFYSGNVQVQSSAPVGFFQVWGLLKSSAKTWVYPKPIAGALPVLELADAQARDKDEDWQILNKYQQGDSLSRVYWRRYAVNRELWIKGEPVDRAEQPLQQDGIALDEAAISHHSKEMRLSVLSYWVLKLTREGTAFSLRVGSVFLEEGNGQEHQSQALKILAEA